MANKTMGRGLKELFDENSFDLDEIKEGEVVVEINLDDIKPNPFQPRKLFSQDKIDDLAASIKEHGIFQPIIVKATTNGYIIVSGERRFRAAKQVGLETIPAIIRNYDNTMMQEIALIENLQREDLTPIEEALAYKNIIDNLAYTQKSLANRVGKSRSHITNMLGLLSLPNDVQEMIQNQELSMGHARVLSKLKDEKRIIDLANKVVQKHLSVRDIEELSKEEEKNISIKRKETKDPKYISYERKLANKFGGQFKVTENKIVVKNDDANKIIELIDKLLGDK